MKKYLILLVFIFISGCSNKTPSIEFKNTTIEVYSEVYLYDLIASSKAEIVSENFLIDTTKTGTTTYDIELKLNNKTYTKKMDITVVDTVSPIIIPVTKKTIEVNYENDLCGLIVYADNYDRELTCTIKGQYDVNQIGEYDITYKITDSNKNSITSDIILNVIEKTDSTYEPVTIAFDEILNLYKTENTEIGIDVSRWQGEIDFNKVKEAGATFVFIRIGVQTTKNGEIEMDSNYLDNIKNAKEAGLDVGVYLYSMATSTKESIEQANWVIEALDGIELDLPIVFDWESWSKFSQYKLNLYDINSIASAFITTLNKNGYESMLYSSKNHLEYIWDTDIFDSIWLAHYTDQTTYQGNYQIWQLSDVGIIDGINSYVDINILYK